MKMLAGIVIALMIIVSCATSGGGTRVVQVATTEKLLDALWGARPGDDIRIAEGVYGDGTTVFPLSESGTAAARIAVHGAPGSHVVIRGRFKSPPKVDYYDLYNMEIDGAGLSGTPHPHELILAQGKGIHVYAMYLHTNDDNCVSTFGSGDQAGQVFEDLVLRDCHYDSYVQNDFDAWGYKKFVHNVYLDARDRVPPDGNRFLFHGYTQSGVNSGIWLEENVFRNGRVLVGGTNNKTRHSVWKGNVFYESQPSIAYTTPSQVDDVSGNRFWKSPVSLDGLCADCSSPNRITNNKLWEPAAAKYGVWNSLRWWLASGTQTVAAGPHDLIDGNQYYAPGPAEPIHTSYWFPNHVQGTNVPLAKWRADLQDPKGANCRGCEENATVFTTLPLEYSLFRSATEPGRGVLALIAAGATAPTTMAVDLSPVVAVGSRYALIPARLGQWGAPTLSGVYEGGAVQVPVPLEFEVYVIVPAAAAP